MQPPRRLHAFLIGIALLALPSIAAAQAVFLARHVLGRVEQMSQTAPSVASYDVASVIVNVDPARVFDTIKRRIAANAEVKVTRIDDARRSIDFTDGTQIGGMQVNTLGDGVSQLMVSTARPGGGPSATSTIVERVLSVCSELKVSCQKAQ